MASYPSPSRDADLLRGIPEPDLLADHYAISHFWERLVFGPDYQAPEALVGAISLTPQGQALEKQCVEQTAVSLPDVRLAIYGLFYWVSLFVDHHTSDLAALTQVLSDELADDRVRLPYLWGRLLHDKLHANPVLARQDSLPHDTAWEFLNESPVGVFQHGRFLSGPFGITRSSEARWVPAHSTLTCFYHEGTDRRRKAVPLLTADQPVNRAYNWLSNAVRSMSMRPNDWHNVLCWHGNRSLKDRALKYWDAPVVLADCLTDSELNCLLTAMAKTDRGDSIRRQLRANVGTKPWASLPPHELGGKLKHSEKLQLLLAAGDDEISGALDSQIVQRGIDIPPTELRRSRYSMPSHRNYFPTELSALGIRPAHPEPFVALCMSIMTAYATTNTANELQWRLGVDPTADVMLSLAEFVRTHGPEETVRKLILTSHAVTAEVCKDLGVDLSEIQRRDDQSVPRILWKYGFAIPRHDDVLDRLNRRLIGFEALLAQLGLHDSEREREAIRAEGVNLFVSVEEFLDRLVSFNAWLLSSDHWHDTRFEYRLSQARRAVASAIGGELRTADGTVRWRADGENPLGTQLAYLIAIESWLESRTPEQACRRPHVDETTAADDFGRRFAFMHTQLWADAAPAELHRYREALRAVSRALCQAEIAAVRNGLDHQRASDRFPTEERLLLCVTRLKQAAAIAARTRVYPVTYWFESMEEKGHGWEQWNYRSNNGDPFALFRPSSVCEMPRPSRTRPVVFAPVNFLGSPDSLLLFKVIEESEYSLHWLGFPRIAYAVPSVVADSVADVGSVSAATSDDTTRVAAGL